MIPFNKSYVGGCELEFIRDAIESYTLSGDGAYTKRCNSWLSKELGSQFPLLTQSATAALEMAALLADLNPGDEVIMPSYTFVSTANAIVLRGAVPVFVDIRPDTLNINEKLISGAISERTRLILPVHYAGVACEMDEILRIARIHKLLVLEDAAQGIMSSYKGRALGSIGDMGAISFHATKNISCGEGGAFLTSNPEIAERAEIVREKGTNRSKFFRGEVDKYNWVSTGSSYLPSELNAAYLAAQLDVAREITKRRLEMWERYNSEFLALERAGVVRRPTIPPGCIHNAHIYYLILPSLAFRTKFIELMKGVDVSCTFHYVPLHSSPCGVEKGRLGSEMSVTEDFSERIVRLPIWPGLEEKQGYIIKSCHEVIQKLLSRKENY
ncbi:MAG: dTDP-4-amino-4,6-dideoxygalactose transaminase [Polynucleobacter sp.]